MRKEVIPTPPGAPERIPEVSCIRAGGFLFFSAIRGRDPQTNKISQDPRTQARQAFENLKLMLEAAGATLDDVVKVTLYLGDLHHRTVFHEIWMEYFPRNPPAYRGAGRGCECRSGWRRRLRPGRHRAGDIKGRDRNSRRLPGNG